MNVSALREHPMMRTLTDSQVAALLPCAREVEFADDQTIFREGERADTQYLICRGCVSLDVHIPGRGVVRVESLCAGDILGLSCLFPEGRWTLDARSVGPVHAIALRADCLRERMRDDGALAVALLSHMVGTLYERLMRTRLQRLDVYSARA